MIRAVKLLMSESENYLDWAERQGFTILRTKLCPADDRYYLITIDTNDDRSRDALATGEKP